MSIKLKIFDVSMLSEAILLCDSFYFLLQILSDEDKRSLCDRSGEEGLYGDSLHGDIGTHGVHNFLQQ